MSDDKFLDSLRRDAAQLRYVTSDEAMSRLSAHVMARVKTPTMTEMIAAWFRPLVVSAAALALAASLAVAAIGSGESGISVEEIEISVAEGVLSVGE